MLAVVPVAYGGEHINPPPDSQDRPTLGHCSGIAGVGMLAVVPVSEGGAVKRYGPPHSRWTAARVEPSGNHACS